MGMLQKEKNRNAALARKSFVTKKAEAKLSVLADKFAEAAGSSYIRTERSTLHRTLYFEGKVFPEKLKLVYNWENRFMSVNYNLQLLCEPIVGADFEETGDCAFELQFKLKGSSWVCTEWHEHDEEMKNAYLKRLANPLIMDRIKALDIVDLEIKHSNHSSSFTISMESMIGSSTWIFIPPIMQLVTPSAEECIKFFELFSLLSDAAVNNKN